VRMAPFATLAGHVTIADDANIGMASAIHQWRSIGAGAMVGMQATVVKDVAPYQLVKGLPARPGGLNEVWLQRAGYADADIAALARYYAGEADTAPEVFSDALAAWEATRRH
jgi:UDP-N-acetylglucosamine acyltransferase